MTVKTGICVAYDWEYLRLSLPSIYSSVDTICLSVDEHCRSWNGNSFVFDWQEFYALIDTLDTARKIQVLKESFFDPSRTPIENECYQRNRMAEFLGPADWYVQIDTDEIIINPGQFIRQLEAYKNVKRSVNIHGTWVNLIKQTDQGFIYSVLKTHLPWPRIILSMNTAGQTAILISIPIHFWHTLPGQGPKKKCIIN